MTIKRQETVTREAGRAFELMNVPADGGSQTLRLELEDRIVTIPLAELLRWQSTRDGSKFVLRTSGDSIVISGTNLGALHSAADEGRLKLVRSNTRPPQGEVWVKTIELKPHGRTEPTVS